jgi:hypothetical protein
MPSGHELQRVAPGTACRATLLHDGPRPAMVAGRWTAGEEHLVSHTTRAILFAALLGLALSGPAGTSRLIGGFQAWLSQIMADSGDSGSIMDPDGLQGEAGGIMDPDGLEGEAGSIMDPNG